jgi:imidazolonepropionase-like amidohydrolase
MKPIAFLGVLWMHAAIALGQSQSALPAFQCDRTPLLIRSIDVWTPTGIDPHDVLVADGHIERIAPPGRIQRPGNARFIDGKGKIMFPGLIDAHAHFVFPGPVRDRKGDPVVDALTFGRQMLASGVTSARVHLDSLEHAKLLLDLSKDECAPMPRLQVSGPAFIPGTGHGDHAPVWDVSGVDDAKAKVRREHELGFQWIAIHDAHKFPDDARAAIVDTARQLGMRILASGYTQPEVESSLRLKPDTLDYLDVSAMPEYAAGLLERMRAQKQITWVARLGIHDRYRAYQDKPALIDDPLNYEFFEPQTAEALRQGVHQAIADRGSDHAQRMDGAYPTMAKKFQQALFSGVPLAMGTDAGSPGQFHRDAIWWEIDSWMKHGATMNQALQAATRGGARVLGDSSIGHLTAGARADFLICPLEILTIGPRPYRECRTFKGGMPAAGR